VLLQNVRETLDELQLLGHLAALVGNLLLCLVELGGVRAVLETDLVGVLGKVIGDDETGGHVR